MFPLGALLNVCRGSCVSLAEVACYENIIGKASVFLRVCSGVLFCGGRYHCGNDQSRRLLCSFSAALIEPLLVVR